MPHFLYECPCGKKCYFKDSDIGREEWCVDCFTFFVVPGPSVPPVITKSNDRKEYRDDTHVSGSDGGSSSTDVSESSKIRYTCGDCGKTTDYPASFAGTTRYCQGCKSLFPVPKPEIAPEPITPEPPFESRDRIGRYELKESLGEGGMGELRVAWDTQLHRHVALKQINPKFAERKKTSATRRMIREAIITAGLTHPNIISIHTLEYDEKESPFYTMPLLEGMNLKRKIQKYHEKKADKSALRDLLGHFTAVCRAVGHAHDRRIMHRDIKPANIHFDGFGNPVLIDWGLAKRFSHSVEALLSREPKDTPSTNFEESEEEFGQDLTFDGQLIGTRRYWAPEYRRTRISAPSNDIYALGLVLYYILCGGLPYSNEEINAGKQHELPTGAKHPCNVNPIVPDTLAGICLKCLYYEPDRRMPDAKLLAGAVDLWLNK